MILNLSLDLPEDQAFVRITRLLGRTMLEYLHAETQDVDDIELLVGELCTNVIRHAHSNGGRFTVVLEYHADCIAITVQDKGEGFSFKDVPDIGTKRTDMDGSERIGGYGMQLIRGLADHLEFYRTDPHGTTVRAEKTLRYRTEAAAREAARLDAQPEHASVSLGSKK